MNSKSTVLSERSQTTYCEITLCEISRIAKFIETENRLVIARDWIKVNKEC